jgi:hypothetical protein
MEESNKLLFLLKTSELDITQLQAILKTSDVDKIVFYLITSLNEFIKNPDYTSNYLDNLKLTLSKLINKNLVDIKYGLKILDNQSDIIEQAKLEGKNIIIDVIDDITDIFLTKKNKDSKKNNFDFLNTLIFDVKSITYLKQILNLYPYYINSKDKNNRHIVVYLITKLIEEENPIYLDNVINLFITNSKFNLNNEDLIYLTTLLKEQIKKQDNNVNIYINILNILLNNEITVENIDIINKKYNIKTGFNLQTTEEIFTKKDYIITIDSQTTLDMDDALSITKENDIYKLKVYITDVSSSVKPGSNLDKEAYRRSETLYLSDQTIPMLPVELSNDILSLNNRSYKKAYVFYIDVSNNGEIISFQIKKDAILVNKKTSYEEVNNVLKNNIQDEFGQTLIYLSEVAYLLKKKNKIKDTYRKLEDIQKEYVYNNKNEYEKRTPSEIIVEECMILINNLTAKLFYENGYPFIYRNHLEPENSEEYKKLLELKENINNNYALKEKYIKMVDQVLKLYPRAYYSPNNEGHFGLNLKYYSHASSPIRRYPDIVIQRLIDEYILGSPTLNKDIYYSKLLEEVCTYCNERMKENLAYQKEYERIKTFIK